MGSNHFQVSRDKGCGNREGLWGEVTSPADLGPVPAPLFLVCLSAPGHHCLLFPLQPSVAAKACLAPGSLLVDIDPQCVPFALGDKANGFRASHACCPFLTYLSVLDRKARFSVLSDHWTFGATMQSDFSHRSE